MKTVLSLFLGLTLCVSTPLTFAQTPKKIPKKEVSYADKEKANFVAKDAIAAFTAKDYEKSLILFKEAYTLNPEFKYLPPIAQCSFLTGRYEEAINIASQFLQESEPDNPKRPDVEKLIIDVRAAIKAKNEDIALNIKLRAENEFSSNEYEKALNLFKDAYDTAPSPAILYQISQCYNKLKRPQEEIKTLESVIKTTATDDPLRGTAEKQILALKEKAAKANNSNSADTTTKSGSPGKRLFVVAGVSGGLGIVSGVIAFSYEKKLPPLTEFISFSEFNPEEIARLETRRKRTALLSDVMFGVALVAGSTAFVIKLKSKKVRNSVSAGLSVAPNGATLSIQY